MFRAGQNDHAKFKDLPKRKGIELGHVVLTVRLFSKQHACSSSRTAVFFMVSLKFVKEGAPRQYCCRERLADRITMVGRGGSLVV